MMYQDVLIGTDVASKGLDFPAIQHVSLLHRVRVDMPHAIPFFPWAGWVTIIHAQHNQGKTNSRY